MSEVKVSWDLSRWDDPRIIATCFTEAQCFMQNKRSGVIDYETVHNKVIIFKKIKYGETTVEFLPDKSYKDLKDCKNNAMQIYKDNKDFIEDLAMNHLTLAYINYKDSDKIEDELLGYSGVFGFFRRIYIDEFAKQIQDKFKLCLGELFYIYHMALYHKTISLYDKATLNRLEFISQMKSISKKTEKWPLIESYIKTHGDLSILEYFVLIGTQLERKYLKMVPQDLFKKDDYKLLKALISKSCDGFKCGSHSTSYQYILMKYFKKSSDEYKFICQYLDENKSLIEEKDVLDLLPSLTIKGVTHNQKQIITGLKLLNNDFRKYIEMAIS